MFVPNRVNLHTIWGIDGMDLAPPSALPCLRPVLNSDPPIPTRSFPGDAWRRPHRKSAQERRTGLGGRGWLSRDVGEEAWGGFCPGKVFVSSGGWGGLGGVVGGCLFRP